MRVDITVPRPEAWDLGIGCIVGLSWWFLWMGYYFSCLALELFAVFLSLILCRKSGAQFEMGIQLVNLHSCWGMQVVVVSWMSSTDVYFFGAVWRMKQAVGYGFNCRCIFSCWFLSGFGAVPGAVNRWKGNQGYSGVQLFNVQTARWYFKYNLGKKQEMGIHDGVKKSYWCDWCYKPYS